MTREVDYVDDVTPVTADWLNHLQETRSSGAWGLHVDNASATQVRVRASTAEPVGIVINGKMRVATVDKTLTISGSAGIYSVFATADTNDRAFALAFAVGSAPSGGVTNYRKIAEVIWTGTALHKVKNTWSRSVQAAEDAITGDFVFSARAAAIMGEMECIGQVLDRTLYADVFAKIGTAYNTGGETASQFRLPDGNGRNLIGDNNGSGRVGAVRGQAGGASTHSLTQAEMPGHYHTIPEHGHGMAAAGDHAHGAWTGGMSTAVNHEHNPTWGGSFAGTDGSGGWGGHRMWQGGGSAVNRWFYDTDTNIVGLDHTHGVGMSNAGNHAHTIYNQVAFNTTIKGGNHVNEGTVTAHNNMPPYLVGKLFIKL